MKNPATIYRFGKFSLQTGDRRLSSDGREIYLRPKTYDTLLCLLQRQGHLVTKDELLQTVWGDVAVTENALTRCIKEVRAALRDEVQNPAFLRTIPRLGYEFIANVEKLDESGTGEVVEEEEFQAVHVFTTEEDADQLSEAEAQPRNTLVQGTRERSHAVIEGELSLLPLAEKRTRASSRAWLYASLAVATLAMVIGAWRWWRPAAPADFYKIVVADFANTTGDATFDQTLKRALEIDLEQSPFLDVMSEREAVGTLQLMGQKADAAITANVATELCVRSNRQVLVTGSIASVGRSYLLTLEATDCTSGKELASAKKQAATKEEVLGAIDAVADRIRKGLGESPKSLESFQVPIQKATTPSLDALKAYSLGKYLDAQGKEPLETLPFFQKAVELDPQFAMAYDAIGTNYMNLNQYNLAAEYYKKAFDLSGRVSEREKFVIQGHHEKDLEQRIKLFQLWAATYPYDYVPWFDLAADRMELAQFAAAIPAGLRALELDPSRKVNYLILARAYERTNRFAEAKAVGAQAVQRGKDSARLHANLFEIAFAEHDQSALSREIQWSQNHQDDYYFMDIRAGAAAALGKYGESEELFRRSYESAIHDNLPETADDILLDQAIMEFWLGLPVASRATLGRIRKPDPDSSDLAILRTRLGDLSVAEHFLVNHENETHNELMAYIDVPLVRATLAMKRQKPADAIAALEPAAPYELKYYTVPTLRGEAYLQSNQGEMAAVEYKKILANPGIDPASYLYPMAHLGLARAYALQNRKSESREEYEKFFASWKDADAAVPVLKQARLEYARLQ